MIEYADLIRYFGEAVIEAWCKMLASSEEEEPETTAQPFIDLASEHALSLLKQGVVTALPDPLPLQLKWNVAAIAAYYMFIGAGVGHETKIGVYKKGLETAEDNLRKMAFGHNTIIPGRNYSPLVAKG